jgi:hypothetical protein
MKALTVLALVALLLPVLSCKPQVIKNAEMLPKPIVENRLPDTGQTISHTDTFGEDADYTINPPSYTDIGNGTVIDLITGLMWQKEDDNKKRTWEEALNYCNDLKIGGYRDWRLPERNELLTVTYYEWVSAIDGRFFPGTEWTFYWSATEDKRQPSHAFEVDFQYGDSGTGLKTTADDYVRCVRGKSLKCPDFIYNGDSTISDKSTSLTWQKGEGGPMNWWEALTYCEELSLAGYSDWRVPNVRELASIMDLDRSTQPVIDTSFFPETHPEGYWSSTSYQQARSFHAFVGYFQHGYIGRHEEKSYEGFYVRCVRGP